DEHRWKRLLQPGAGHGTGGTGDVHLGNAVERAQRDMGHRAGGLAPPQFEHDDVGHLYADAADRHIYLSLHHPRCAGNARHDRGAVSGPRTSWKSPAPGLGAGRGAGGGAASAGRDRTGCAPVTTTSLRSAGADRALITSIIVFESRACSTITTPE